MSLESRQLLNLSKLYREKVAEDKDWGYDKDGNSLNPKDKKKKLKTKDTVDEAIGTAIATGAALGIAAGGAALIPKVKKFGQNLKNKAQQRTQMKTEEKKAVKDFDGDGKLESPEDEYKGSKDKAIKKAIRKESFSNWREDLKEVPNYEQIPIDAKDRNKKIEEKNVKNKVKINPEMKEAVKYYKGDDRNPTTGLPKGLKPDKRKPGDKPMTAPPYNLAKANEEVVDEPEGEVIDETYFDSNTRGVSTKGGLVRRYNKPGKLSQSSLSNERKSKDPKQRMSKKEMRKSMEDDANYEKKMGRSKPTPSNLKDSLKKQSKVKKVSEGTDKAFEYVKKQIAAKYGKSGYVSKDNPRKPQTAAEKKKVRAHQAKVDKENAAARAKDPSQGRYPKG